MSPLGWLMSLALVVSVSASCCTPEKYTTRIHVESYANGTFYLSNGVQYADVLKGVYVTRANYTDHKGVSASSKSHYNIFTGDAFTIVGGKCVKTHFQIPGIKKDNPNCIPDVAQGPTFTVGGPHEDLELFKVKAPLKTGLLETTMTKHHCLPVFQTMYIREKSQEKKPKIIEGMDPWNPQPLLDDVKLKSPRLKRTFFYLEN